MGYSPGGHKESNTTERLLSTERQACSRSWFGIQSQGQALSRACLFYGDLGRGEDEQRGVWSWGGVPMEPAADPPPPTNHKVMRAACHPPGPRRKTVLWGGLSQWGRGTKRILWTRVGSITDRLDDLRQSPAFLSNCGFFLWQNKK